MSQEELERKIVKLEAEIAALKDVKNLLSARTALAWAGMESSAWRHSISNQVLTIRNYVEIIRHYIESGSNPTKIDLYLEEIDKIAGSIGIYPIAPPLSPEEGLKIINLNALIQERIKQIQHNPLFSNIQILLELKSDEQLLVQADPDWIVRGLDILLDNSAEAMASSTTKCLTIKTSISNGQVSVLVEDTGQGVLSDVIPLLFVRPIQKKKGEKSLGIGLLMARMIFQTYKGDLALERTDSQGTVFVINLPQAG